MKLKELKHYYGGLNDILNDGDNYYIKKYTTDGFIKSYEMWNKYSHNSIQEYFEDFLNDYDEDFLHHNCQKCFNDIAKTNSNITYDQLFDILLRRLVLDSFIGFKAEETVKEALEAHGIVTQNNEIISQSMMKTLDVRYNIDIVTFNGGEISNLIQVKNHSTFAHDGKYIIQKRKEFFDKNQKVKKLLKIDKDVIYYIYDKMSYINTGEFKFFVNFNNDKCHFALSELVDEEGRLKTKLTRKRKLCDFKKE